jgi:hypothetical protein
MLQQLELESPAVHRLDARSVVRASREQKQVATDHASRYVLYATDEIHMKCS